VTAAEPDAARLGRLTGGPLRSCQPAGGQHGVRHYRCELADGRQAFAKVATPAAASRAGLDAEARGLRWLAEPAAVAVAEVLASDPAALVLAYLPTGSPDRSGAARFGTELARLHAAGAPAFGALAFGALAFGTQRPGRIAGLPLPDGDGASGWPDWYAASRLLPYLRLAVDAGTLNSADAHLVETVARRIGELAGPAEPPSRIHGDCWSGNVLWPGGRGTLIDPAAHGGHRETDLAMLALFGAPYLDVITSAYQDQAPLADGWAARVPLHQLHPLLVHVCLFGGGYRESALDAARRALAIR
jgi:fructosamine-3-kinase